MPLKKGDHAPDFTLPSTGGSTFTLGKDAHGEALVLYFYPKDFTPGCTKESCSFRDQTDHFRELSIKVIGISTDPVPVHEEFKKKHKLPFELLSDVDGSVSKIYKAKMPLFNMSRRITYLLNKEHTIVGVYSNLFDGEQHVKEILKLAEKASGQ